MNVSFGRIIPVKSVSNPNSEYQRSRVDNSTFEVVKVLNSEKSSKYSREESSKIRSFFQAVLGDYNGKNGILMKRTEDGDLVLLSGKDAKEAAKNKTDINKLIESKIEDGKKQKPDTQIVLSSSKLTEDGLTEKQKTGKEPIKTKLNQFQYLNTARYFTAKVDGFIRKDILPTHSATKETRCENIFVNYNELCL